MRQVPVITKKLTTKSGSYLNHPSSFSDSSDLSSRFSLRMLFMLTFLDHISLNIGFPVLTFLCFDERSPLFSVTTTYATRSLWYGLYSALPHLVAIIAAPFMAGLSDYYGRKKILLIGALGTFSLCFFTSLGIWVSSVFILLLGAIVAGCCTRTEPVALAVIGDCGGDNKNKLKNMGYLQFYISIGAFLGPMLGGYLAQNFFAQFNFSLPYIVGSVIALLAIYITWYRFQESITSRTSGLLNTDEKQFGKRWWQNLSGLINADVINLSLILVLTQISWRLYYQFMPPFLKLNLHYNPTQVGAFVASIAIWLAIASWLGLRFLSAYFKLLRILYGACWMMGGGVLLIIGACLVPSIIVKQILAWLSALPMAMGDVIAYSVLATLYSEIGSVENQGTIMGVNYIVVSLVWAVTGLLGGYLVAQSATLPLITAALPLLGLFLVAVRLNPNSYHSH